MMSKKHDDLTVELNRLKKLVPGLDCTEIYGVRTIPLSHVCYLENRNDERFYIGRLEGVEVLAGRVLECSKELLARIQKNVNMLQEIVDGN